MTGRTTKEWVGKTPDSKVPPAVRLRVLRAAEGKCHLTGILIADGQPFDLEHIVPLSMGGEHREMNLRPALKLPHEVKTAAEAKIRAKTERQARKAFGEKDPDRKRIESAGFKPVSKRAVDQIPMPPRINIYTGKPFA